MADTDTQLEFKKRARRRLVGAAAIALFAAIILPMIMDREPRQAGQDIQIRIPSQEGANFASRAIQGTDPAPAQPKLPESVASVPAVPVAQVSSPLTEKLTPPAPRASEPRPVAEASHPKADKKPEPEKKPSPEKKPEVARKPAEAGSKTTDPEAARAAAILGGGSAETRAPVAENKGFVVQLGAFKDAANAASIRARAKAEGYNAYAERLGDKTRVRAGPFPTREEAEKAAAKLSHAGLSAIVAAQ